MLHIGMSLKVAVRVTECLEILNGEISSVSESGVKTGSTVSLGKYKTVTIRLFRILGVNVHFFKVQIGQYIGDG